MIYKKHRFKLNDEYYIIVNYDNDAKSNYDHFVHVFRNGERHPLVGTSCKEGNKTSYLQLGKELLESYLKTKDINIWLSKII